MAGSKNIIGRNRNIADRSTIVISFRVSQRATKPEKKRKREREGEGGGFLMIVGRNEKNETHSTDGLLKEETSSSSSSSSSSVGICRWNEEEQRLEISERGGNKVDGRTKEGEKKRVEKSLGKKKSGIQARTHGIDGDEINMESVSRKIIVIKGVRAIHRETSFSGSSLADHRGAIGIGRQHRI